MKLRYSLLFVLIGFWGCSSEPSSDTDTDDSSSQQSTQDDATDDATDNKADHLDKATIDLPEKTPPVKVTHVISSEATYYLDGPQQMRPPDGKFKMGTKVELVQENGSYSQVVSEDGIRAHVSTGSLKPIE